MTNTTDNQQMTPDEYLASLPDHPDADSREEYLSFHPNILKGMAGPMRLEYPQNASDDAATTSR